MCMSPLRIGRTPLSYDGAEKTTRHEPRGEHAYPWAGACKPWTVCPQAPGVRRMRRTGVQGSMPRACAQHGLRRPASKNTRRVTSSNARGEARSAEYCAAQWVYAGPGHGYACSPIYSGKFIFRKNALYRGSACILLNDESPFINGSIPLSFWAYARSSHLTASLGSPRNA
jgi:hypothetical protein